MKVLRLLPLIFLGAVCAGAEDAPAEGDFVERFDTLYNSLTLEKTGSLVELRAKSRRGEFLESAVDLEKPLDLAVAYTRTLYAAQFLHPDPQRVLIIGLGGAGFHRLFAHVNPDALLHSVELDPKVYEIAREHMGFEPTENTPVSVMDGRLFIKRNREQWDWIILDAYRGGYVPPHLKTREFYRECARRLSPRGVLLANLHSTTQLYYADLKTLYSSFRQVALFRTHGRGNVIAMCVDYEQPVITDPATWASIPELDAKFEGHLDFNALSHELESPPNRQIQRADVMTDDFSPVEFLNAIDSGNTTE